MASCLSESSSTEITISEKKGNEVDQHKHVGSGDQKRLSMMPYRHHHHHQPIWNYSGHMDLNSFGKPTIELDLIGGLARGPTFYNRQELQTEGTSSEIRVYDCHYCDRKFHSSQALGGHQNAHKSIRALVNGRHTQSTTMGNGSYGNGGSSGRSSSSGTSLGIMAQSMVQKPPLPPRAAGVGILYRRSSTSEGGGGLKDEKEEFQKLDLTLKL
ncbi:hypothetical protein ZOSMA_60G00510 [Zostera marina]|uniref:C2H2-type domain-containing protein n=1 Tax=Zostera marina TaxID=29655 RepID=A0A0K9NVN6_ZOSMR|nr:hypothetical protein ZOSMA_60G00510 [Zostera marina]